MGHRAVGARDPAGGRGDRAQPGRPGLRSAVAARSVALGRAQAVSRCRSYVAPEPRDGSGPPRLIVVAMMRHGDKLASYRLLGEALSRLLDLDWSLEVVGDGAARREVEHALAPLGRRVVWAGALGAAGDRRAAGRRPICSSGRRSTRRSAWRCSKPRRAACRWWPVPAAVSAKSSHSGETGLLVAARRRAGLRRRGAPPDRRPRPTHCLRRGGAPARAGRARYLAPRLAPARRDHRRATAGAMPRER